MSKQNFIITIDGPAGTGKTTLARKLAEHFHFFHLKGGTFLRSFTYHVIMKKIEVNDETAVITALEDFNLNLKVHENQIDYDIFVNELNVTTHLWTNAVDAFVSTVSSYPRVRQVRRDWLRNTAKKLNIIADGRTLGTEIFPDANIKFYLDAKLEIRASRRWLQQSKQFDSIEAASEAIKNRDEADQQGFINRLAVNEQQIYIDTSGMSFNEIFASSMQKINLIYLPWLANQSNGQY